jgi:aminomethyltransferase
MRHTPLHREHREANAKLVDFAGWEMPIQYTGVLDEYHAVRSHAGLFDVSHMGRLVVSGPKAGTFLQQITTNDVARLTVGQAHYSMVCNDRGGIKDDIFVYRLKPEEYLLCVNASNRESIVSWLALHHEGPGAVVEDRSDSLAQIALQGPQARDLLLALGAGEAATLKLHHVCQTTMESVPVVLARTGYTGELGFELYVPADRVGALWRLMLERGRASGLKPAGLGARDLLRLEMGYLLYGNDITEDTTPLEAGVEWTVSMSKGPFIGRDSLQAQLHRGLTRRFIGFELLEKGVPRHGYAVLGAADGKPLGAVTSGNLSPLLQKGIGLAYVPPAQAELGTELLIEIRGKALPAKVVRPPFYRKPKS